MKVMILIKADEDSEAGVMPDTAYLERMGAFNEELVGAGVMLDGNGLHPSSSGVRVDFAEDGTSSVTDGPFAETKELLAGYWIWQVKDMDEAVAWARRIPIPDGVEASVEIRQVGEPDDFGDELTPELREKGAALAEKLPPSSNIGEYGD